MTQQQPWQEEVIYFIYFTSRCFEHVLATQLAPWDTCVTLLSPSQPSATLQDRGWPAARPHGVPVGFGTALPFLFPPLFLFFIFWYCEERGIRTSKARGCILRLTVTGRRIPASASGSGPACCPAVACGRRPWMPHGKHAASQPWHLVCIGSARGSGRWNWTVSVFSCWSPNQSLN